MLSNMAPLNKLAFASLIFAKFASLAGISLGFIREYHHVGGYFLFFAFVLIAFSIFAVLLQTSKDKKTFFIEDEENKKIKTFLETKRKLEDDIRILEDKKKSMITLKIKNDKWY